MMSIPDLNDFATRYTAAWCDHNAAGVASFFSETGSLQINDAPPAKGRDAIAAAAQGFMTAFPDLVVTLDRLEVSGDRAKYYWTLTGTNTGSGGSGNKVQISGYEQWQFGPDGLVAESRGHFNQADYNRQISGQNEPD